MESFRDGSQRFRGLASKERFNESMHIRREVKPELGREIQSIRRLEIETSTDELLGKWWRTVHGPGRPISHVLERLPPKRQPHFLADVNRLPSADQRDQHAPARNALAKSQEVLRLGQAVTAAMNPLHLLRIVRTLRLVEHDQVLRRDAIESFRVVVDVGFDGPHERLAATAAVL